MFRFIYLMALLPLLSGCSSEPEYAEVEGTITLNGKPLADIEVVFIPDSDQGSVGASSSAYTDAQGHYRLYCERMSVPGAWIGKHRVCLHDIVSVPLPPDIPETLDNPRKRPAPRIPQSYSEMSRTPLRDVEVVSGKQTLDFDIPTKRK